MLALCNIGLDFQNKTSAVQLVVKPYMPHPVRLSKERPTVNLIKPYMQG